MAHRPNVQGFGSNNRSRLNRLFGHRFDDARGAGISFFENLMVVEWREDISVES
jgi:hypothetical protein